ncbi:MAG TPA: hypothetical protein VFT41_01870 [Gemmatimonadaceae bacterium]|nr:hypothetical protein [Gemmatimonadaceae bacterium]
MTRHRCSLFTGRYGRVCVVLALSALAARPARAQSRLAATLTVAWRLHGVSLHSYTQAYGIRIN